MIDLRHLNEYRRGGQAAAMYGGDDCAESGAFLLRRNGARLRVIASAGGGWDHVSVSLSDRCPTWDEMEHVKRLFFKATEAAMQLHVPPSQHVNIHPFCLHLWRPHDGVIPMPPADMV